MARASRLPRVLARIAAVGGLMAVGAWLVTRAGRRGAPTEPPALPPPQGVAVGEPNPAEPVRRV
jgi:hypothetical protein